MMSIGDLLFQPRLWFALAVSVSISAVLSLLENRLHPHYHSHVVTEWIAEHVLLPIGDIFALLGFIAVAYPALFGIEQAPSLLTLLHDDTRRTGYLINSLFLISLLLPLLPILHRLPNIILPIQGMLATALIAQWLADYTHRAVTLWPGAFLLGIIVLWAWLSHRLAQQLARWWAVQTHTEGSEGLMFWHLVGVLQLPSILIYAWHLGRQLR